MRNRLFILLIFTFLGRPAASFAAENTVDPREIAVDRAVGGMEEGSRPLLPQAYSGKNQAHAVPGANLSPSSDTQVTASANAQGASNSSAIGTGHAIGNPTGTVGQNTGGNTNSGTGNTGPSEPATEPSGGGAGDSIVNVDANVDLSGGEPAVDANLAVDTNAGSLADVDAGAASDLASVDATAAESGNVAGHDLNTAVNEAPLDATLETEVVATDIPAESEATAGLEADVDPVTADSDVPVTDPADGLSTGL